MTFSIRSIAVAALFLLVAIAAHPADNVPALRLPTDVVPVFYDLDLQIAPKASDFNGTIAIDVRLSADTHLIWLNASQLTLVSAEAKLVDGKADAVAAEVVAGDDDFIGLRFAHALPAGAARLVIRYRGNYDLTGVAGIFKQTERGDAYI